MVKKSLDAPTEYKITIQGAINPDWSDWFGGLSIKNQPGEGNITISVLTGTINDQSALHGILKKINDLNLVIVSLIRKD